MNRRFSITIVGVLVLLCSVSTLHAQSHDVWVSSGFLGNVNHANIGDGWNIGFRLGFKAAGPYGHEFQYTYNRPSFSVSSDRMEIHQAGYNFLYYFGTRESTVHPFVTAGVHFEDLVLPGSVTAPKDSSVKFGFNYGAGLKIRLSTMFGFRADVREYQIGKPDWGGAFPSGGGLLYQTEASAGLGVYF
jgi:opacity protein-like surface antigen